MFPDDELLANAVEDYYPAEDNSHASLGIPGETEDEEDDSDDDFCILEHPDKEPEGLSHEVIIKSLTDEPVSIMENHFTVPVSSIHTRSLHLISSIWNFASDILHFETLRTLSKCRRIFVLRLGISRASQGEKSERAWATRGC